MARSRMMGYRFTLQFFGEGGAQFKAGVKFGPGRKFAKSDRGIYQKSGLTPFQRLIFRLQKNIAISRRPFHFRSLARRAPASPLATTVVKLSGGISTRWTASRIRTRISS